MTRTILVFINFDHHDFLRLKRTGKQWLKVSVIPLMQTIVNATVLSQLSVGSAKVGRQLVIFQAALC